jgi:Tol biopolymer transport system component
VPVFAAGPSQTVAALSGPARLVRWIDRRVFVEMSNQVLAEISLDTGIQTAVQACPDPSVLYRKSYDVTADASRVVFAARREGRHDLWTCHLASGALRQLTTGEADDLYPIWGDRAGSTVFYQTTRSGQADIWRVTVGNLTATPITVSGEEEIPEDATADGRVVSYQRGGNIAELWRWSQDTGAASLTDSLSDMWPTVSADGTLVAFQRRRPTLGGGFVYREADVFVGTLRSSQLEAPERSIGRGFLPRLSPSGRWLAFLNDSGHPSGDALSVHDLQTKETMLVTDRLGFPGMLSPPLDVLHEVLAWGPSETLYFYVRTDTPVYELWRINLSDPARSQVRILTGPRGVSLSGIYLSSDGRHLAYCIYLGSATEVRRYDLETGRDELVYRDNHGPLGSLFLRGWQADGRAVVALRYEQANADGSQPLEVLSLSASGIARRLAFVDGGFGQTARLDGDFLYLTTTSRGAHNVRRVSLPDAATRLVTDNARPGVSYSGLMPAGSGSLLFSRLEQIQDIWTVTIRPASR